MNPPGEVAAWLLLGLSVVQAGTTFVNLGRPVASLWQALQEARGRGAKRIEFEAGTHYLNQTLELTEADKGTTWCGPAAGEGTAWLSGGLLLHSGCFTVAATGVVGCSLNESLGRSGGLIRSLSVAPEDGGGLLVDNGRWPEFVGFANASSFLYRKGALDSRPQN